MVRIRLRKPCERCGVMFRTEKKKGVRHCRVKICPKCLREIFAARVWKNGKTISL